MSTLVMKFGGAATQTPGHFKRIAEIVKSKLTKHPKIVVVVSAMGQTTNQLIALANQINKNPPQREFDMLISAGERISMALLAMTLHEEKIDAISFTGSQSGIITCANHTNAQILDVKPYRILENLQSLRVVIVAGFQGVSLSKEITTLGRGGSDTSAVGLALALEASHVEFYKDVRGIYNEDPKKNSTAFMFNNLTYQEAHRQVSSGDKILHPRAISLAEKNGLPMHVKSFVPEFESCSGTWVLDKLIARRKSPLFEL